MTDGKLSGMVEVQCSDLAGPALDWAVAKVDGVQTVMLGVKSQEAKKPFAVFGSLALPVGGGDEGYSPSVCWHCGGPLISKYHMDFCCEHPETIGAALCDENGMYIDDRMMFGKTHLIAACRAIVAAHLGEVVSVPAELVENK